MIRHVTRGGSEGEESSLSFFKSALNLGKNALTRFIYGIDFSFKMLFQAYLGKKYPTFFPAFLSNVAD